MTQTKFDENFLWPRAHFLAALDIAVENPARPPASAKTPTSRPMHSPPLQDRLKRAVSRLTPAGALAWAMLGVALIGMADRLPGLGPSLTMFFVFPVGFAAWHAGRKAGTLTALAAVAVSLEAGRYLGQEGTWVCNGLLQTGFLMLVVYALGGLRTHVEREKKLARTDVVTGIPNRRAFMEHFKHHLSLAAREDRPISLAYIDLDDFKHINDRQGHRDGDRLLRLVAGTLAGSTRDSDFLARFGGDEFALVLPGANRRRAEIVVAKLRGELRRAFAAERTQVTCSIGCVTFYPPPPSMEDALHDADALMYRVKAQGKDGVAFCDFRSADIAQQSTLPGDEPLPEPGK